MEMATFATSETDIAKREFRLVRRISLTSTKLTDALQCEIDTRDGSRISEKIS
jgi:hypothetical protein